MYIEKGDGDHDGDHDGDANVNASQFKVGPLSTPVLIAQSAITRNVIPTSLSTKAQIEEIFNFPGSDPSQHVIPTNTNSAERIRQNRDNEKERLCNTLMRVEELKLTLNKLVARRDAKVLEWRQNKERDFEVREVAFLTTNSVNIIPLV